MRISDWSSDVCSSDLVVEHRLGEGLGQAEVGTELCQGGRTSDVAAIGLDHRRLEAHRHPTAVGSDDGPGQVSRLLPALAFPVDVPGARHPQVGSKREPTIEVDQQVLAAGLDCFDPRSEEHTSELQSLMRISYSVFCLKKKNTHHTCITHTPIYF